MNYYEVLAGSARFHGSGPLTYCGPSGVRSGAVVRIALQSKTISGIVVRQASRPAFEAKPIDKLLSQKPIPPQLMDLLEWLNDYYPAPSGIITRLFLPPTPALPKNNAAATKVKGNNHQAPFSELTDEQSEAIQQLSTKGYHLLHGVTGSGKTRVYLELAKQNLSKGRSVLVLTPEIGLTSQIAETFISEVASPVHVIHSQLKESERRDLWHKILGSAEPQVIIGPRSALFAPIYNLGLIVMDESHDQSYKSDSAPNYRTERVAAKLASLHNATFISGTATPNIDEYFVAVSKHLPIVNLTKTAIPTRISDVNTTIVNLRDKALMTSSSLLSDPLIKATKNALDEGKQVLLFLNRRGTASTILCNDCGWQLMCNHCDLPVTYHGDSHTTICHVCGRKSNVPVSCNDCHNTAIVFRTLGTKALASEAQKLFPSALISRFDTDTEKAEQLYNAINNLKHGSAQIIIGTQMITKGLDLPLLSVVGIVSADSSLAVPDFTATERTFQLISQVSGRVGRGHNLSKLFVQTYRPDDFVINAAAQQNWNSFYQHELKERQIYAFPPYVYLLRLTCARASSASAERSANQLVTMLRNDYKTQIEGPSPAFHPKENGKYVWQLIVKNTSRKTLTEVIKSLPSGWRHDIDPIDLL